MYLSSWRRIQTPTGTVPVNVARGAEFENIGYGEGMALRTIDRMRRFALGGQVDPMVVRHARAICGGYRFDKAGYCFAIRQFLEQNFSFVYDSRDADVLTSPREMLESLHTDGRILGDCDENATLGAALGLSVGLDAQFVLCAFNDPEELFSHVWAELSDGDQWHSMDVTHPGGVTDPIARMLVLPI